MLHPDLLFLVAQELSREAHFRLRLLLPGLPERNRRVTLTAARNYRTRLYGKTQTMLMRIEDNDPSLIMIDNRDNIIYCLMRLYLYEFLDALSCNTTIRRLDMCAMNDYSFNRFTEAMQKNNSIDRVSLLIGEHQKCLEDYFISKNQSIEVFCSYI